MAVIRLMRLLGILLASLCALAATAAADPIDEPARPAPEAQAASAPATEGTGVADAAGPSEALRAPDTGAKSRAGNPLSTVPLSTLAATRDRPLFSASRRPPTVARPIVAPPPKQEAPAPAPPERPLLTLIGTIFSPKASVAMLQGSNTEAVSRLRLGQENNGWRVQSISLRSIVVEKAGQSLELALPRPNVAPVTKDVGGAVPKDVGDDCGRGQRGQKGEHGGGKDCTVSGLR
jgi:general secretion pathway protein N